MMDKTIAGVGGVEVEGAAGERRQALERLRRSRRRTFYSIGEVCSMLGIKPHVLRYWETQFKELSPSKNRSGNRVYRADEIELIALIHRLVHEERYTVEGARKRIAEARADGRRRTESTDALRLTFLRSLDRELREVHELLDPASIERGAKPV
ncbi:MAG: MerR family transcriptional regulator [Gemmatimonas sp.]|nr:MerR family transcriptional regulator [Gemmatimonas sp.]